MGTKEPHSHIIEVTSRDFKRPEKNFFAKWYMFFEQSALFRITSFLPEIVYFHKKRLFFALKNNFLQVA